MLKKWRFLLEELIFLVGIVTALALVRSRYDYIEGNPVPVVIFKNEPTVFHAFIIALNFGFTAAVLTISLRSKSPTLAQFCRIFGVACVVLASGLLSYSALLPSYSSP